MRTRGWAHRLPARIWHGLDQLRGEPWPYTIVALHRVEDEDGEELSYPTAGFRAICRYWRDHFETVPLDILLARLAHGDGARHPTLSITFDDGYADNAENAAPILDANSLSATFFVTSGAVGAPSRFFWDRNLPRLPRMMSWDQVRELRTAGFGIGSHTVTHARLSQLRPGDLRFELETSRRQIEAETGGLIEDFAYPFGAEVDCGPGVRDAVQAAGYRCCLSCHGGVNPPGTSPYQLQRISLSPVHHARPADFARACTRWRWQESSRPAGHW